MDHNTIVIDQDGSLSFIYTDDLVEMLQEGEATIRRASNVEPAAAGWTADMSPSAGPLLGPYPLRADALAAEVSWLRENDLGAAQTA